MTSRCDELTDLRVTYVRILHAQFQAFKQIQYHITLALSVTFLAHLIEMKITITTPFKRYIYFDIMYQNC